MSHAPFELIDRIACLDLGGRGITGLYVPARARVGLPLCLAAAQLLDPLQRGDTVFIITGSMTRPHVSPTIAENDGPLGAAVLARSLSLASNLRPVLLADEPILPKLAATIERAGCVAVSPEQAARAIAAPRRTAVAATASVSADDALAQQQSQRLLDELAPKLVISIERAGLTADGTYRNMLGEDYSEGRARFDHVVQMATARGIPTIGIGDGGNEIGMGAVRDAVHAHVPHGPVLCAELATDVLIPAGVSNWGAYAVVAALAILRARPELAHHPEQERYLLQACPELGLVDGTTGRLEPTVDGMDLLVHTSVVALLSEVVRGAIAS